MGGGGGRGGQKPCKRFPSCQEGQKPCKRLQKVKKEKSLAKGSKDTSLARGSTDAEDTSLAHPP